MKGLLCCFFILFVFTTVNSQSSAWFKLYNSVEIISLNQQFDFDQSTKICSKFGGELFTINSKSELDELSKELILLIGFDSNYWIEVSDRDLLNSFPTKCDYFSITINSSNLITTRIKSTDCEGEKKRT